MKENLEKPYYEYRINTYITVALIWGGIVGIALAVIFTLLEYSTWILILCWALGAILLIFGVLWHLSLSFASDAEKIQQVQNSFDEQLRAVWDGKGKVLDIGTGLGRVAIEIGKQFPESEVIGVDTWAKFWGLWGMTKAGAERNAMMEKVSDRCTFQYGNALNLPFRDREFQLVVSTFTFHEIHVPDRTVLFKEVVRVLAPGGRFMICDAFRSGYKVRNVAELLKKIEQMGVEDVKYKTFREVGLNFGVLTHMISRGAYLSGRKVYKSSQKSEASSQ